jgi:hypothetical protein
MSHSFGRQSAGKMMLDFSISPDGQRLNSKKLLSQASRPPLT